MATDEQPNQLPPQKEVPDMGQSPIPTFLERKYFWGALAIITMWLAVLFVGVYGETDFVSVDNSGNRTEVPVVWGIALFAFLASWVVGFFAFREPKS